MAHDSTHDTLAHINEVRARLYEFISDLERRSQYHDRSKLSDPMEKAAFDVISGEISKLTYGSEEYKAKLAEQKPAIDHHYAVNDHHPEHFPNGIHDMNLMQLVEMLADWKAATMRHEDGDLRKSIYQNAYRFGYGDEIENLLIKTAQALKWL